ncbi:uncharacterized protein LOC115210542 [Octopus sinensis]|uniref:Uncharacterized protein LOC115210542 n=1 Tax=Octopus sinensis TaxID=2607531 RepID=A0A6P7S9Z3_9MOLL|nr:uncharacterized protein LOC115210542 [Octopus sinensis]
MRYLTNSSLNLLYCRMPAPLARLVKDLITDPHPDANYVSVKSEVLRRNTPSAKRKFQTLMQDEHLGSRTPSEFLRRLCELSDTPLENNPLLRKLFFSQLLPNVQSILATTVDSNSLDQIATIADKIIEFTVQHTCSGPVVASSTITKSSPTLHDDILERIDALARRMDTLSREHASSRRPRSRSRSKSRSSSSTPTVSSLGWYHATFKDKAHRSNCRETSYGRFGHFKILRNFSSHRAFFVKDRVFNESLMVDTGSSCSIWPLRLTSDKQK